MRLFNSINNDNVREPVYLIAIVCENWLFGLERYWTISMPSTAMHALWCFYKWFSYMKHNNEGECALTYFQFQFQFEVIIENSI